MKENIEIEWKYDGAFLIQFRPETDLDEGRFAGRVEHVASYEAAHFQSLEGLLEFVARTLKRVRAGRQQQP